MDTGSTADVCSRMVEASGEKDLSEVPAVQAVLLGLQCLTDTFSEMEDTGEGECWSKVFCVLAAPPKDTADVVEGWGRAGAGRDGPASPA